MLGYTYTTEELAILDRKLCNDYYGYPKEGCETLNWINYYYAELDGFYYIRHHETLNVVLGEPIEFTITEISPI